MKRILYHGLTTLAMLCALAALGLTCYWMGRIDGMLSPVRDVERILCVDDDTALRASPTGYILADVPEDAQVWLLRLDLPFARVAYFEDGNWLEGTVSAFALEVCK